MRLADVRQLGEAQETARKPGRPKKALKPQQFSIRMHLCDRDVLGDLCDLWGLSKSDAIVRAIRIAHDRLPPHAQDDLREIRALRAKYE
jgi:hypothetical protein